MRQWLSFERDAFLLALQFLTRIPIGSDTLYSEDKMAASPRYYPVVGALLGSLAAALYYVVQLELSLLASAVISTAGICLLTGAFHEDGLADCFDGIGGGHSKDQSLTVMKDSRIGTYGAAALLFVLGLKVVLLASLSPPAAMIGLIAAHCLSRLSSLIAIATSSYVRLDGTGKYTAQGLTAASRLVAFMTGAAAFVALGYSLSVVAAAYAFAGLALGHMSIRLFYERKLGGYTGDTLGAVQQVSEVGVYIGIAIWQ